MRFAVYPDTLAEVKHIGRKIRAHAVARVLQNAGDERSGRAFAVRARDVNDGYAQVGVARALQQPASMRALPSRQPYRLRLSMYATACS